MTERILALFLALPFIMLGLAAWRFWNANPGAKPRTGRDYAREVLAEQDHTSGTEVAPADREANRKHEQVGIHATSRRAQ